MHPRGPGDRSAGCAWGPFRPPPSPARPQPSPRPNRSSAAESLPAVSRSWRHRVGPHSPGPRAAPRATHVCNLRTLRRFSLARKPSYTPKGLSITAQGRDAGAHPGKRSRKPNPEGVVHRARLLAMLRIGPNSPSPEASLPHDYVLHDRVELTLRSRSRRTVREAGMWRLPQNHEVQNHGGDGSCGDSAACV